MNYYLYLPAFSIVAIVIGFLSHKLWIRTKIKSWGYIAFGLMNTVFTALYFNLFISLDFYDGSITINIIQSIIFSFFSYILVAKKITEQENEKQI